MNKLRHPFPPPARRATLLMVLAAGAAMLVAFALAFALAFSATPANAGAIFATPLCGSGSPPDYGFSYDLMQAHWTVDYLGYVSEQTVREVDLILDQLNADAIAQTMILFQPQDQVGNRVNCAVHFLRYMQLGLPDGERKDNGFVFVIVVEATSIDVHYGVGLGLPALTAAELTPLNRAAEAAYATNNSLDEALLALVREYDTVARSNYAPLRSPTSTARPFQQTAEPFDQSSEPLGLLTLCCMSCIGIIVVLFVIWVLIQMMRMGITFNASGSGRGSGGWGFPGGGGSRGSSGWPSRRSGGFPSLPRRGGSGSGRSGRGN